MEFKEFNLHPDLARGLEDAGYISCMPVQEQVLTNAFGGHDLYVQSQTGTGKTAAFLVVIFQRLLTESLLHGKKAIIMVPTRELAVQVEEEAKLLGKYLPFKVGSFYGGVGYGQQQQSLRDHVQILVGTPGRVLDLNSSGQMNLMDIAFLVLDEADRMFDMGFYPDLRKLIKVVPPVDRRQTMLFSATLNAWVKNLAWEYTKSPLEIEIAPETVTVDEVEQILYHVPSDDKMRLLLGILERDKPESALVFCNTKRYAEIVAKRLRLNGIECEFIIGDLPQVKRLKIIDDIKAGRIHFLVATDVAARGLDIEGLALVVNYDLPVEAENYVHRIGRTARAGKTGKAITLVSEQDVYELPAIERYIGKKLLAEIAREDLYGQDKSQGMRIRTDSYDGRNDSRDERRHDDRYNGRRDDGERRRDDRRRREGGRTGEGRASGSGRNREAGRRPREDRQDREKGRQDTSQGELSHLSFDERMAFYKEKYDASGGPGRKDGPARPSRRPPGDRQSGGAGNRQPHTAGEAGGGEPTAPKKSNRPGGRRGGRRPQESAAGSPPPARASEGRKNEPRQGGRNVPARPGRTGEKPAPGKRPPEQVPKTAHPSGTRQEKPGLLARITGFFKKPRDSGPPKE
ncbi:MAG: DEAD/DEAH box helicase [Spirochaetaceae bacterium]|jgi:ATP-dependent RNA helicase RhlB|nr:DEAD/DEAH box helicase [Spirochaetaceae bacterium]